MRRGQPQLTGSRYTAGVSKLIKVSDAFYAELQRRAVEESRTMIAVVDGLLGIAPGSPRMHGAGQAGQTKTVTVSAPRPAPRRLATILAAHCSHCGCSRVMHKAETGRCERHPSCRWREG